MINRVMHQLSDELRADGVAEPVRERFLLAAVWDDLCRLTGEVPPPRVHEALAASAPATAAAVPSRTGERGRPAVE